MLRAALRDSEAAGLPEIAVSAAEGKLLHLLAQIQGATRVLEIGTLGGYSTIWLARALPADGRVVTLEYSAQHAEVATRNIARAGLDKIVEVRVGPALSRCPSSSTNTRPPSTWSSSTPTRATTRTTSSGPSSSPAPAV